MNRRPPISTRPDTLFPYTTLFRSTRIGSGITSCNISRTAIEPSGGQRRCCPLGFGDPPAAEHALAGVEHRGLPRRDTVFGRVERSEERRVGKECVSTCRSRGSPYH